MHIGLQLYTVRDQTAQDFKGTIRRVAEMGYEGVEFAGYGNLSAAEMRDLLQETGLKAAGTHVSLLALQEDAEREIKYCREIGCPHLVLPWLGQEWINEEGLKKLAPILNELGKRCRDQGITFAFHNHAAEFTEVAGAYWLDRLFEAVDAETLQCELDTYWAAYAGVDPVAYLKRLSGRVPVVHIKDMTPERTFTEAGAGTLPIPSYIEAAQAAQSQWYLVENDAPQIPSLESAQRSLAYLKGLK
ncbi:sugar phosphate isomerase/epimerase [Thermosporothrix hazakensis]|jgi:sugar phosphate isomerase/epimerase|uniref:Sugar phosphate isomerase/epimerase n=2 Tax=Thermosporothrix TaxID=768650 RepID=A0A326U4I5_THEHA|nr:sugar phosphate isomerase/epimerase [Thermosporothrix hazakensis]PZW26691.1 sugar phosphate isomerase/epimerase [Thermosporothrix hazakensis]BBH89425.1 sugar phosphate isomerase [Thermosporothrix sp. COM3]GCE47608.1 sugar phosphate isomerase [Thermosporothrix hazakensis]